MICFPNAKINLGLQVINKRDDEFHNIETVFFPIGFSDILECTTNTKYNKSRKCVFVPDGLKISGNINDNLIVKAYQILDQTFDLPPVLVHLNKIIPMGAGLGGGSSDAAYMIKLLNELCELNINDTDLHYYASQLGSDCTFFIKNEPAYLFGKGHELEPFNINLKGYYLVLIYTGVHSSTAMAYKHVLKRGNINEENNLKHILGKPVSTWRKALVNDFEPSVFRSIPELADIKSWLYTQGALYASMSGSGSCMFGIFDKKPALSGKWKHKIVYTELL